MVGQNFLEHPASKHHQMIAPSRNDLNLLDRAAVRRFIQDEKPDVIIHAAGRVGGIQANMAKPVEFLRDNLDMGLNVITSAASVGIRDLINLASSCMYPRHASNPLAEELILTGQLEPTNEGYALAKIVSTRLCEYISQEHADKNYKTLIPCNLYGRFDKFDPTHSHLIPAVIRKIHEAKQAGDRVVDVWGDGEARREFMLAKDFAGFVFFALENLKALPQNLNVGLGHDYTITEYYEEIASVVGFEGSFSYDLTKPVGMRQKLVDIEKLSLLGWRHTTNLADGVRESYEFFKEGIKNEL